MKQSRAASLTELIINVVVGFGISLAAQAVFLPLLGVAVTLSQNLAFAGIMTVISIAQSYLLRRLFEALHIRVPLSPAILAVIAERRRQIEVEGWTAEHDDGHKPGELAAAGACYARYAGLYGWQGGTPPEWPWSEDWWKPGLRRRDLVKGCALVLAEIEKFDRGQRKGARP